MTTAVPTGESGSIRVLHVDDEPGLTDLAAEYLERADNRITVRSAPAANEALELLSDHDIDCIISDYDMPGPNGIEFLEAIRREHPDLPFILYTGKGSEAVASEAISAGVTDYLQKEAGTDQYTLLANRVVRSVESYRSQQALADRNRDLRRYEQMINSMQEAACIYDENGRFVVVNEYLADWYGTTPEALEGNSSHLIPTLNESGEDPYQALLDGQRTQLSGELEADFPGHGTAVLEYQLTPLSADGAVEGVVGVARDITEKRRRRERHERQRETLVELATDEAVTTGDFETAARHITEAAADVIDVPRVNIWLTEDDRDDTRVTCIDHYDRRTDAHTAGMELDPKECPAYFEALGSNRAIAATDAREDPRTAELTDGYLDTHGIGALLDGTLRSEGDVVGVVCHEHVGGPREWTNDEIEFASGIADVIQRALRNRDLKARERELREEKSFIEGSLDALDDAFYVIDGDGQPLRWNDQVREITGYTDDEIAAMSAPEFFPDDHRPRIVEAIEETLTTGSSVVQAAYLTKDGKRIPHEFRTTRLTGPDGELLGIAGIGRDVREREARERQLEEAKRRLNLTLAETNTGVWEWDVETDEVTWDETLERTMGLDSGSFEGTLAAFKRRVHPDDRAHVEEKITDAVAGDDLYKAEFRMHHEDGDVVWASVRGHVIDDGDGERMVGIHQDITQRKTREADLERTNELLSTLIETLPVGVLAENESREVLAVNDRLFDLFEISGRPDEHIGADCERMAEAASELFADPAAFVERIDELIASREPTDREELVLADERVFERTHRPIDLPDGQGALWMYRDVSNWKDQKRKLTALNDVATEFTRSESVAEICEQTIAASREILSFDLSVIDIEEDGVLKKKAVSTGIPPDNTRDMTVDEGLAGKTYRSGQSFVIDDVTTHEEANPQGPYRAALSVPIGDHGVFQAVTETAGEFDASDLELAELLVSHAEAALNRLAYEQQLERQNERLEEFAEVVSHDLRNPLQVAEGRLEMLREECSSGQIDEIEAALGRMRRIINDVLWLAREGRDIGEIEPVELHERVRTAWSMVAAEDEHATLRLADDGANVILADDDRLCQLLENLFRNAVDHAGPDVVVTVGSVAEGFYIEDTGPGIPDSEREAIFDAGYSTSADGTGFGLNIVKQIVDAHDWTIDVMSGSAGGARFEITGVNRVE